MSILDLLDGHVPLDIYRCSNVNLTFNTLHTMMQKNVEILKLLIKLLRRYSPLVPQ